MTHEHSPEINPSQVEDEATPRMKAANEGLRVVRNDIKSVHGEQTLAQESEDVGLSLGQLVRDTCSAWSRGELSAEKAQDMLLIALQQIGDEKHDSDPETNGAIVAAALSEVPPELLEGALREYVKNTDSDEVSVLISEIDRNNPSMAA